MATVGGRSAVAMSESQQTSVPAAGSGPVAPRAAGGGAGADLWPVRIAVPGGEWRFTSVRRVGQRRDVVAELVATQSGRAVAQDLAVGRIIEERVGFPLPEQVHDVLRRIPGEPYFSIKGEHVSMAKIRERAELRPHAASEVFIHSREPLAYGDLFGDELALWNDRDVQVEIIGSRSTTLRPGGGSRLTYRILQEGAVIFAGDDVTIPAGVSPASIDALRTVIAGPAGEWNSVSFTQQQRDFVATRGSGLSDALARLVPKGAAPQDLSASAAPEVDAPPPPFEDFAIDL
jgi:hypothetical protein